MDDTRENDVRSRRDVLSLGGALVAGAAAGATLLGARTAQAANETTLKIAVVDIGLVFKKYKRKEHLEKEINAKKDKVEADQKELQVRIEGIRKDLKLAMKQYEVQRESQGEELNLEIESLTLQILDEIEAGIREFGVEQKYDLVLKVDSKGFGDEQVDPRGMGDERFRERIFRANVSSILFHDPKLDVTETILAKLNDAKWLKKCEEAKAAAPPAPPPPAPPGNQKPKDEHK